MLFGQSKAFKTSKDDVRDMDKKGEIKRNLKTPIKKDNIMMPVGGWAVVRFKATNPGELFYFVSSQLSIGLFFLIEVNLIRQLL